MYAAFAFVSPHSYHHPSGRANYLPQAAFSKKSKAFPTKKTTKQNKTNTQTKKKTCKKATTYQSKLTFFNLGSPGNPFNDVNPTLINDKFSKLLNSSVSPTIVVDRQLSRFSSFTFKIRSTKAISRFMFNKYVHS